MIEIIEIIIQSGPSELLNTLIVYPKNICYKNNKKYNVTNKFLEEITRIIRTWKNEYGSDINIDSEEFRIIVKTKEKEEMFHGKGIFPDNYNYLKELIGGLHD